MIYKLLKNKKRQSGQSAIEFIFVSIIILVLIFAFLQLAWVIGWGHYVHYATFMSSRAYFSAHKTKEEQLNAASTTLENLLMNQRTGRELLSFLARARTGDNRDIQGGAEPVPGAFIGTHPFASSKDMNHRAFSWAEGVQYNFEFRLFILPLASLIMGDQAKQIQVGEKNDPSMITWNGKIGLASDSWLGREVSNEECHDFLRRLSKESIQRDDGEEFLFDNGC